MNIIISEIDLYDLFKAKFGEKEAKSLVSFVKTEINNQVSLSKDSLATRADLQHLENKLDYRIANSQEKMMWLIGGASTAILTVMFALFSFLPFCSEISKLSSALSRHSARARGKARRFLQ